MSRRLPLFIDSLGQVICLIFTLLWLSESELSLWSLSLACLVLGLWQVSQACLAIYYFGHESRRVFFRYAGWFSVFIVLIPGFLGFLAALGLLFQPLNLLLGFSLSHHLALIHIIAYLFLGFLPLIFWYFKLTLEEWRDETSRIL